jgi:hypothetical protein
VADGADCKYSHPRGAYSLRGARRVKAAWALSPSTSAPSAWCAT